MRDPYKRTNCRSISLPTTYLQNLIHSGYHVEFRLCMQVSEHTHNCGIYACFRFAIENDDTVQEQVPTKVEKRNKFSN